MKATVTTLKTKAVAPFKFTDATVRALQPRRDRYEVQDAELPRLRLRVTPAGGKSYSVVMRSRTTGKLDRVTIGSVTDWNVRDARNEAAKIAGHVLSRTDVAAKRRNERDTARTQHGATVAELLEAYIADKHLKGRDAGVKQLSEATATAYRLQLGLLLGKRINEPVARLSEDDLVKLHAARATVATVTTAHGAKLKRGSAYGADLAVHALAAVCKFHKLPSPTGKVYSENRTSKIKVRGARLEADDAPAFVAWLDYDAEAKGRDSTLGAQNEIMILAFTTGLRAKTLTTLEWADLNLNAKNPTVTVPADKMKNKTEWVLPLSPFTAELLRARLKRAGRGGSTYVFPRHRDPLRPAIVSEEWRAGLPYKIGPHDARKVFTRILGKIPGRDARMTKYLLTHKEKDITFTVYDPATAADARPNAAAAEAVLTARIGNRADIKELDALHTERATDWRANKTSYANARKKAVRRIR